MPEIAAHPALLVLVALAAYLLGAVPFGIVVARLLGLGDLRTIGSGNIGATNVLRTGSKAGALATLLLDAGKGAAAALIARAAMGEDAAQIAGLAAFAGHVWPVYLRFHGGKGVATFLGTLIALAWPVGLAACATWLAVAALTRYSSLSAMVAALAAVLWAPLLGHAEVTLLMALFAAIILWTHRENIARLRAGTESKIGRKG